jgi:cyanophycin synthetase
MREVFVPPPCEHCGADPIPHGLTRLSIRLNELFEPVLESGERGVLSRLPNLAPLGDRLFPALFSFLTFARLGEVADSYDERDMLLTQVLWKEAQARGIKVREFKPFGLTRHLFSAEHGGRRIAYEGVPFPNDRPRGAWWLDDKSILKREFKSLGFPVPAGRACRTVPEALELFKTLRGPVIVKPHHGSATRHTTLHIKDEAALERAVKIALEVSTAAVVEEEMEGPVYRATLVAGELIGVLRRDAAEVVGDGEHTVAELIGRANEHPKRSGPYFHPIKVDAGVHAELAEQNLAIGMIPEAGQHVRLQQKLNWSLGGTTTDVTDETHSDNAELFRKAAAALHAPLVGIDFIIKDVSKSWKETGRCGIIECNSMPFFDNHHLPFEGKPRNVAGAIWDMVFPASARV